MQKVSNVAELKTELEKKYGENILFTTEEYWGLYGELHGKKIEIEPCEGGWVVSVSLGEEALLDELTSYFNELLGCKPMCRYNTATQSGEMIDISIEWNTESPGYRMKRILTGKGFNRNLKAVNLEEYYLSNERKMELSEFNKFSPVLFKGYRISDERLYHHFAECSEADLFLIIATLRNFWNLVHSRKWADGWPEPGDVETASKEAWEQVEKRFLWGTDLASEAVAWSKWWNAYFTADNRLAYIQKRKSGEDVSDFRPEGSWQDLIDNPVKPTNNSFSPQL